MKKVFILVSLLGIALIQPIHIFAETTHTSVSETEVRPQSNDNIEDQVGPQKDIIRWKFKTIKGHIYKRQYNYSKGKWIGSWQAM